MPKIVGVFSKEAIKPKGPDTVFMKIELHVAPGKNGELYGRSCFLGEKKKTLEEAANIQNFGYHPTYIIVEVDLDQ